MESVPLHDFQPHRQYAIILWNEDDTNGNRCRGITKTYMANPLEGMTSEDIRCMSEDDLLDMDYFLNEDDFNDELGEEGFYLF